MQIIKAVSQREIPTNHFYEQYSCSLDEAVKLFVKKYNRQPDLAYISKTNVISIPAYPHIINVSELIKEQE
jgi:hypothetical protein